MSNTIIPQFETRHRLSLALEAADVDPDEMAQALGVTRTTVYNYMSGARSPKLGMIKSWALRCQVPWEWIVTGELPGDNGGGDTATVTIRNLRGIWRDNSTPFALKLAA